MDTTEVAVESGAMSAVKFRLDGRSALVTGAGRGMGRAMALALAGAGARVAVQDIEPAVAGEVVERIRAAGGEGVALPGDITVDGFAEEVHAGARAALGPITVLVNNAAVQEALPWTEVTPARMHWQYQGNVVTPLRLMALCHPEMKSAKFGRVVNVSSIHSFKGHEGMIAYGMTKASIDHLTRSMAREFAPDGITINSIAPGYFDTHRNRHEFPDAKAKQERGQWVPMKRVGEPEDVVGAVLLLTSDAGSYITGQTIHIDGGIQWR